MIVRLRVCVCCRTRCDPSSPCCSSLHSTVHRLTYLRTLQRLSIFAISHRTHPSPVASSSLQLPSIGSFSRTFPHCFTSLWPIARSCLRPRPPIKTTAASSDRLAPLPSFTDSQDPQPHEPSGAHVDGTFPWTSFHTHCILPSRNIPPACQLESNSIAHLQRDPTLAPCTLLHTHSSPR